MTDLETKCKRKDELIKINKENGNLTLDEECELYRLDRTCKKIRERIFERSPGHCAYDGKAGLFGWGGKSRRRRPRRNRKSRKNSWWF
jgi:hypothetical protein